MTEDQILDRIAIEAALKNLEPDQAEMMRLIFGVDGPPADWTYEWPPTYEAIGIYVGTKYWGFPFSEATVRYRRKAIEDHWAGKRGKLRLPAQKNRRPAP